MQKSEGKKLEANGWKAILKLLDRSVQRAFCPGLQGWGWHSLCAVAKNILRNQEKSSYAILLRIYVHRAQKWLRLQRTSRSPAPKPTQSMTHSCTLMQITRSQDNSEFQEGPVVSCPDRLPKQDELQGQTGLPWALSSLDKVWSLKPWRTEDAQISGHPSPTTWHHWENVLPLHLGTKSLSFFFFFFTACCLFCEKK